MIPQRLALRGFLCYRDEQEIVLDGGSLWLLTGANGSGKSTIFDAMTYALFGYHRGGSQQVVELLNHDADKMQVEFEFALDGQQFRIRRTATRPVRGSAKTTQQIARRTAEGTWEPLETTGSRKGFDQWIREHIGLNYETFTSSVLLLQGRAEKLLDASAAGRFAVLAAIVDLERYQRLHERADAQRKHFRGEKDRLGTVLDGLPAVTEEEFAAVEGRVQEIEAKRQMLRADEKRLLERETQARHWADLQKRRGALDERTRLAEATLAGAATIEQNAKRLQELTLVLPHVSAVIEHRQKMREAAERESALATEFKELGDKRAANEHAQQQTRDLLTRLEKQRNDDETKHRDVSTKLRELAGNLSRVQIWEQQKKQLEQHVTDRKRFPDDLAAQHQRLRDEIERLAEVERMLPLLALVARQRTEWRKAMQREADLSGKEQALREAGERRHVAQEAAEKKHSEAQARVQEAEGGLVAAQTLLQQAQAGSKEFQQLEGATTCRYCGQLLTPKHYAEEKRRRKKEVTEAQARDKAAAESREQVAQEVQQLQKELTASTQGLQEARDQYRSWKRDRDEAQRERDRCDAALAQTLSGLSERWKAKIGPIASSVFPSEEELAAFRAETEELPKKRKEARKLEERCTACSALDVKIGQANQLLRTLEVDLPNNVEAVQREHATLLNQESILAGNIKAQREAEAMAVAERDGLGKEAETLHRRSTEVAGERKTLETEQRLLREEVERVRLQLPESWQTALEKAGLAEIHRWRSEKEDLVKADAAGQAERLEQARHSLASLQQARADWENEASQVPAEARVALEEVQEELQVARTALQVQEEARNGLRSQRDVLLARKAQREEVARDQLENERQWKRYDKLAELLGRERLQRHLVQQAERQVVDHANQVLDRLSSGQLYLKLCGGEDQETTEKALELEAFNRTTGQAPINVAFLSGSQRFRVAVSLALGIGQHASRRHRPIESVIIDEGFGCLDRQGRQVMIQELQNLRGELRCVLLVSHQEEFADAFADGYRFALIDGTTKVERFER